MRRCKHRFTRRVSKLAFDSHLLVINNKPSRESGGLLSNPECHRCSRIEQVRFNPPVQGPLVPVGNAKGKVLSKREAGIATHIYQRVYNTIVIKCIDNPVSVPWSRARVAGSGNMRPQSSGWGRPSTSSDGQSDGRRKSSRGWLGLHGVSRVHPTNGSQRCCDTHKGC